MQEEKVDIVIGPACPNGGKLKFFSQNYLIFETLEYFFKIDQMFCISIYNLNNLTSHKLTSMKNPEKDKTCRTCLGSFEFHFLQFSPLRFSAIYAETSNFHLEFF